MDGAEHGRQAEGATKKAKAKAPAPKEKAPVTPEPAAKTAPAPARQKAPPPASSPAPARRAAAPAEVAKSGAAPAAAKVPAKAPAPAPAPAPASAKAPPRAAAPAPSTKAPASRRPAPKEEEEGSEDEDSAGEPLDEQEQQEAAIAQAIAQMGAGKLNKKQKADVAVKAKAMLAPVDASLASLAHLHKIVGLAFKHSKAEDFIRDGTTRTGVREYQKLLLSLSRQPEQQRKRMADTHINIFRQIYAKFKRKLQEDDLTWLDAGTREKPNGNDIILVEYGKRLQAKLPLSALYHYLNDTNVEEILKDAGDLDYHLWSLFSKLAEDPKDEKRHYEELADAARATLAPEQEMVGISAQIRDQVLKDKSAVDIEHNTADSEKIISNVFKQLGNSEAMQDVMKGFTESAANGTFDIQRVISVVKEGVHQPMPSEDGEDDGEDDGAPREAPVAS